MKRSPLILAALLTVAAPFSLSAATVYWDTNDVMPGAGPIPDGFWGGTQFWSSDAAGEILPLDWVAGDTAVFSAGTDAINPFVVTLSGVQTAAGLTVEEGSVSLAGSAVAVGAGTILINSGAKLSIPSTLSITATVGASLNLEGGTMHSTANGVGSSFVSANFTINVGALGGTVETANTGSSSTIFGGTIKGPGNVLTKTGSGEFRYQGLGLPNTTYAKLVVNQGLFRLGFASSTSDERGFGAVPAAPLADAITLSNGGSIGTSFTAANSLLHVNRGITLGVGGGAIVGNMTIPGVITGDGSLSHLTTGTVNLRGINDYNGITFINLGIVVAGNANALGSVAGDTQVLPGGELRIDGTASTFTLNESLQIAGGGGGGGGAITVQNASNPTISSPVTLTADATVTVSGTSTVLYNNPAAFTGLANQNLTLQGGGITTGGGGTITGVIALGSGGLTKLQGGRWTLTAGNTYSGTTTIGAGTLQLGNGLAGNDGTISNSASIINNGSLVFNRFGNDSYGGVISGFGSVTKTGPGTHTLSGANTHVGGTTVSGGTLKLGNASALGFGGIQTLATGSTTVVAGFTLDLNGAGIVNEPFVLNGAGIGAGGALVNTSGTLATIGNGIAGAQVAALVGTGSGYATAPAITFNGTGSGAAATAALGVTAASFTLDFGDKTYTTAPTVTISGGSGSGATATAILSGGATGTLTGINITNAGIGYATDPVIVFGAGTFTSGTLSGSGVGNSTEFTVSGVAMTAAGSGYTGTPTYTFDSGNATPGTVTLSSVTLAADTSIGGAGDIAIRSAIIESGGVRTLTKTGVGTVSISGLQSYSVLAANEGRTTLNSALSNATITNGVGALLNVNANASGSSVTVAGSTEFSVSQTLASLDISATGVVTLGSPAFAAADGLIEGSINPVQPVPEPASLGLLALGALGILGRRRSAR